MPRPLRAIGIPLLGILLVLFFVYRGFPYDRLAEVLAPWASRALKARVEILELRPWLSWAGPGLQASGVEAVFEDGRRLQLDRARLRPAWSTAWLRGRPALAVALDGEEGSARGTWVPSVAWRGDLRNVEMAMLPRDILWPGLQARGRLDAHLDLSMTESGPEGEIRFEARSGTLHFQQFRVPLRYKSTRGELRLGGDALLELVEFAIEGPSLTGSGKGRIGRAQRFEVAPLDFELQIRKSAAQLNRALANLGVRLSRSGGGRLRITGTPSAPRLQ